MKPRGGASPRLRRFPLQQSHIRRKYMTDASLREHIAEMRLLLNIVEDDLDPLSTNNTIRVTLTGIIAGCDELKRAAILHRTETRRMRAA